MRRLEAIAAATAGAWLVLSAGGAQAAQADRVDAAKAAASLAAIISSDARDQLRVSRSAVTVTKRCCGVRVLRVHYGVKGSGPLQQSSYVLRLETRRGDVQGVAVFESTSEARSRAGVRTSESSSLFAFAIHHARRSWTTVVSYEQLSRGVEGLNGHAGGLGFAKSCGLSSTLPRTLYAEVLRTLERAKHHRAFAPDVLGPSLCLTG